MYQLTPGSKKVGSGRGLEMWKSNLSSITLKQEYGNYFPFLLPIITRPWRGARSQPPGCIGHCSDLKQHGR